MGTGIMTNNTDFGPRLIIKTVFPSFCYSHVKDKTVGEAVLSLNGNHSTGKTEFLYWDGPPGFE